MKPKTVKLSLSARIPLLVFSTLIIFLSNATLDAKTVKGIVVNGTMEKPIPGSMVMLFEKKTIFAMAMTDSAGMFSFENVSRERFNMRIKSMGFAEALVGPLLISKLDSLNIVVRLDEEDIMMDEIIVEEKRVEEGLRKDGFYERKEAGWGKYLTPEDLKGVSYQYTSNVLRRIHGIIVVDGQFGDCRLYDSRAAGAGLQTGELTIYLDGLRLAGSESINIVSPGDIAGIEFYHIGNTPVQYYGRSGSLLIWTKK